MAKFVSQIVSEIRGSINGVTFARNRYGLYARSKASPVQPRTPAQTERRAQLTVLSQRWRTLEEKTRAEWRALADELTRSDTLGLTYRLSGLQAYLQFNLWRALLEIAVQDDPPPQLAAPSPIDIVNLSFDIDQNIINIGFSPSPYSGALGIWATAPFSRGVNFVAPSRYRLVAVRKPATFGGNLASPQNIGAAYQQKFGLTVDQLVGKRVAFALTPVSYGTPTTAGVAGQRTTFVFDFV